MSHHDPNHNVDRPDGSNSLPATSDVCVLTREQLLELGLPADKVDQLTFINIIQPTTTADSYTAHLNFGQELRHRDKRNETSASEKQNHPPLHHFTDEKSHQSTNATPIVSEALSSFSHPLTYPATSAKEEQSNVDRQAKYKRAFEDLLKSAKSTKIMKNANLDHASSTSNLLANEALTPEDLNFRLPAIQQRLLAIKSCFGVKKCVQNPLDKRPKHSLPFLIPCSRSNLSNSCHIQANLQALIYCPFFYNFFRSLGRYRFRIPDTINDSISEFFWHFLPDKILKKAKYHNQFKLDPLPRGELCNPTCLSILLENFNKYLNDQQEGAEVLYLMLKVLYEEKIKKEYQRHEKQLKTSEGKKCFKGYFNEYCALNEIFVGTMRHIRTAGEDTSRTYQPFFWLELDIQADKIRTVEDALKAFSNKRPIYGYTCPKTNKTVEATSQMYIKMLPNILIMHLKPFNGEDGQKKEPMKKIEYPIYLEIPTECRTKPKGPKGMTKFKGPKYELLAIVHHDGQEANQRHYFTDIYDLGVRSWLRCHGSEAKPISAQQALTPEDPLIPYLLFYGKFSALKKYGYS